MRSLRKLMKGRLPANRLRKLDLSPPSGRRRKKRPNLQKTPLKSRRRNLRKRRMPCLMKRRMPPGQMPARMMRRRQRLPRKRPLSSLRSQQANPSRS